MRECRRLGNGGRKGFSLCAQRAPMNGKVRVETRHAGGNRSKAARARNIGQGA